MFGICRSILVRHLFLIYPSPLFPPIAVLRLALHHAFLPFKSPQLGSSCLGSEQVIRRYPSLDPRSQHCHAHSNRSRHRTPLQLWRAEVSLIPLLESSREKSCTSENGTCRKVPLILRRALLVHRVRRYAGALHGRNGQSSQTEIAPITFTVSFRPRLRETPP